MNRRFIRNFARWLLPLLVVRAFLPVGFMLAVTQADGLQLAFCPDQAPIVQSLDHEAAGHAGHTGHDAGNDQQHPGANLDSPCAFAVAAVAAVIDVPHLHVAAQSAAVQVLPAATARIALSGPQRIDLIRGPPALS